jgi:hypothetical protein
MNGKITLITPPDIFENSNLSILFIHLGAEDQDIVSKWLSDHDIDQDVNLYVYTGEPNVPWFLYAMSRCDYKYIDISELNYVTQTLIGYALGKSDTYYKVVDENVAAVCSHINNNRISRIETFLERIFSDQGNQL